MVMSARKMFALAAGLALAWCGPAAAQEFRDLAPGATAGAPATLADLKGMLGGWVGKDAIAGFSAPFGGEVVGHLVLLGPTGTPRVLEFWVLRPEGGSVLLSEKLYTPTLKDREEKDKWQERRLVAHDAGHLYFENMTMVTNGDAMDVLVRQPGANGAAPNVIPMHLTRVK
jgi:hypothetical protein